MTLPLPISPIAALSQIIDPALRLLPARLAGDQARLMVLATMLQEVGGQVGTQIMLLTRVQGGDGPARGLTQFERGGVAAVLGNPVTAKLAAALCAARGVPATSYSVHTSVAGDDILAAGLCRLNFLADPHPLPALGDIDAAWACYLRVQRPGAYQRDPDGLRARWSVNYAVALATVRSEATP